ncbi:hypothetical protein CHS0354_010119 [Potamilus streckersoni]|uniref:Autophagy-related protein 27 n=1 Tax=Potamilus streckersoni TaxID=2493646 RepID=A0AAE0RS75_9BIVA|nr:hypothetical protein CHS0354_010119 [Potamilus streckersoni]
MDTSLVTCALFIQCILMLVNMTFSDKCLQISACACKSSNGTIDLSPLSKPPPGDLSRFTTKIGDDPRNPNAIYHYNPCNPMKVACSTDSKCAVCQQVNKDQNYSAGSQSSAVMAGDPDIGQLNITYQYNGRTSVVKIECDQSQEGVFEPDPGEKELLIYIFKLRTKYGCYSYPAPPNSEPGHNGISIGSILVIIFFVLLLVYIVGGMLFLHYVRGAQGIETFPNLAFWKELPFLVKDGIVFVFRGCKTDVTYTKI